MRPLLKRALHGVGSALGLVSVVFIALRLNQYAAQIDLDVFDLHDWSVLGALALTYGSANILLALAWQQLLMAFGAHTNPGWAIRIYGLSQLAKYIPGNIFHLAGRQALGLAAGLPGWALAKSALWELALISIIGALFAAIALPLLLPEFSPGASLIIFFSILVLASIIVRFWGNVFFARALGWQTVFLAISGSVFVGILALIVPHSFDIALLPSLCGAYVLAWLAGLITPGAPAGVGVRELVLLALLGPRVAEADLLLAVLMGRVVTVGGDIGFFVCSSIVNSRKYSHEKV